MSNNRSTSTKAGPTLGDMYNEFFKFLLDFIVPILPTKIKEDPTIKSLLDSIPNYCSDDKRFVMVHYGLVKKMCLEESGRKSISSIIDLVDPGSESGALKLTNSVQEIKTAAASISEICTKILSVPDSEIQEEIEKFCLYVEILTKQFMPRK